jgi:hypothetical protein
MATTFVEDTANISPLKMGEPIRQVEATSAGAETAIHTFTRAFAEAPKVLSIGDASVSITGISTTGVAISTTAAVSDAVVLVQGKVAQ